MSLNIRELLCGDPIRLRYTIRFSTCRVAHHESVAEHSYFVALYAMFIARWCMAHKTVVDSGVVLEKALVHDLEEALTGDVPRSFKYSTPDTKCALDRGGEHMLACMSARLFLPDQGYMDRWLRYTHQSSKNLSKEGRIVAFADFLSVLSYLLQERIDHNQLILQHCGQMGRHFAIYSDESFDFIRPLVDEAGRILHEELFSQKGDASGKQEIQPTVQTTTELLSMVHPARSMGT